MTEFRLPDELPGKGGPDAAQGIIKLASLAVGGQGGGVLNGWIVDLARQNGYAVQATSVAGVAQRTGATVYYVEMTPRSDRQPVFALAPSEDDVDILLAAELMEAGRAMMRRFVTAGKTRVVASTHRQLATVEKVVPGDGIAASEEVIKALDSLASDYVAFDMQTIAEQEGTVISAALFGALAGSGALPFEVDAFRDTVRRSGRGVERSLAAFDRAFDIAQAGAAGAGATARLPDPTPQVRDGTPRGSSALLRGWQALEARCERLPTETQEMAHAGLVKVVAFQDLRYGGEYLDRLEALAARDEAAGGGGRGHAFTATAAKYLANAMAYDDIIRVADAKTSQGRFGRIEAEVRAGPDHLLRVTEYTHPGAPEIVSLMPAPLGRWVERRDWAVRGIDRLVNRGRHIRTDRLGGFLSLYCLAGLRRWRRSLLRHRSEARHVEAWLELATSRLAQDYDLAVQTLCTRRLIKGYSDTHARGLSKFDRVLRGSALVEGREDAADWTRRLIAAALKDPEGKALDGALDTIAEIIPARRLA